MANSRLKILKNKKEIQIKQLRRELAQLLEAGNTPTARIRVRTILIFDSIMFCIDHIVNVFGCHSCCLLMRL